MREIRGWNIGEVVTANEMTLNSANIYEETGSNGEANLPCIYNGLTLQSQSGTGNSIVTFNPGVCRCQDLPVSTYTYLPANAYGTGYPCYIDISVLDSNTVITLTTSPTTGYIVATFAINPTSSGAVNYTITGSLLQIATGSYNPAIHVRLCSYNYTGSTFVLNFTPNTSRDTDFTGIGGINWNYQNSSLEINTPASQTGNSIVVKQPLTVANTTTLQNTTVIQGANALQFYNAGNTHYTSLQAGAVTSNVGFILPISDGTPGQAFVTNGAGQMSLASISSQANIQAPTSTGQIYTASSNPYQIGTATAARTDTMPSILTAGVPWTIYNNASSDGNYITLQTSGSNTIVVIPPLGYVTMIPLTGTPTTASNWLITDRQSQLVSYTPILSASFGSASLVNATYKEVGDTGFIYASFKMGTVASGIGTISLPGVFSINPNKLSITSNTTSTTGSILGSYCTDISTHNGFIVACPGSSTSTIYIGGIAGATGQNIPMPNIIGEFTNTEYLTLEIKVPIL